jgi:hypothetical protein
MFKERNHVKNKHPLFQEVATRKQQKKKGQPLDSNTPSHTLSPSLPTLNIELLKELLEIRHEHVTIVGGHPFHFP